MATGLHLATVAFSVRNCLAAHGASRPPLITAMLRQRWDSEVSAALAELKTRGMVLDRGEQLFACIGAVYSSRGAFGNVDLGATDERAWQGWR